MIGMLVAFAIMAMLFATALADDDGREMMALGPRQWVIKDNQVLYDGSICLYDPTTGEVEVGATTAGLRYAGIYRGPKIDNTDDGLSCILDAVNPFRVTGSGFSLDDVDKPLYVVDDNTVSLTRTGTAAWVGNFWAYISATECWVCPPRPVFPNLGGEGFEAETVADPAADGTTNGRFAVIGSLVASAPTLSRTDGLFTSLASVDVASAVTSASFSATPSSAELAAFAALVGSVASVAKAAVTEAEVLGDDVTAVRAVQASHAVVLTSTLTEAELVGDAARAGLTYDADAQAALVALGLFTT